MTSNRQLLAVGVGMVVVAALIVGVVLWMQNGDDSDDDSADDGDNDTASTEFDEFADRGQGYQLLVPEDWVVTSLGTDVADVGEDLYPRNGRKADAVDRMAAALPRSVVMFGAEDDELAKGEFVTNMNLNVVPEARELTTEQVAEEFKAGIGSFATVVDAHPFDTKAGPATRVRYDANGEPAQGVGYVILKDGKVWTLALSSADLPGHEDQFDTIAASFDVTSGG